MIEASQILMPAPGELVGERIIVRPYRDEDASAMNAAVQESVDHIRPWQSWYDKHQSVSDTLAFIRRAQASYLLRDDFPMGIFARGSAAYLGGAGLHIRDRWIPFFEIGYWIRKSEEGKGYVSDAVGLLTECAFELLGAQRLLIRCNALNTRSSSVAQRQGFVFEGRLRRAEVDTSGRLADTLIFAMVREDYEHAWQAWRRTVSPPPTASPEPT